MAEIARSADARCSNAIGCFWPLLDSHTFAVEKSQIKNGTRSSYILNPYPFVSRTIPKCCHESPKPSHPSIQGIPMPCRTLLPSSHAAQLRQLARTGSHNRPTQQVIRINKIRDNPALLRPRTISLANRPEPTHTCIPPTQRGCVMCDAFKTPLRDETRFTFQHVKASAGTSVTARSMPWEPETPGNTHRHHHSKKGNASPPPHDSGIQLTHTTTSSRSARFSLMYEKRLRWRPASAAFFIAFRTYCSKPPLAFATSCEAGNSSKRQSMPSSLAVMAGSRYETPRK